MKAETNDAAGGEDGDDDESPETRRKTRLSNAWWLLGGSLVPLIPAAFCLQGGGTFRLECHQAAPAVASADCVVTYQLFGVELERRPIPGVLGATAESPPGVNRVPQLRLVTKSQSFRVHNRRVSSEEEVADEINAFLTNQSKTSYRARWSGTPFLVVGLLAFGLTLVMFGYGIVGLIRALLSPRE